MIVQEVLGMSELAICNHPEEVVLSGRMNVGDFGVVSLVRSTQKLQTLNLEGCINIMDLGLKYLADGGSKSCLYNLSLNNCGMSITDVGIAAISHIESLWALDISKLNVTDVSLVEISGKCRSLHSIFLNGCMAITGDGFRALTNCGWIGELAVVDCPNITWDDVVFVGCALEVLEYLSLDRRMENEAGSKTRFSIWGEPCPSYMGMIGQDKARMKNLVYAKEQYCLGSLDFFHEPRDTFDLNGLRGYRSIGKFDIEKFNGNNDSGLWKIRMCALMVHQGCDAALETLSADMEAGEKTALMKKAYSTLILYLRDRVLRKVTKETNVAGI
nr:leucine-rich repeat, cysteine-containing subtype [Tanacetum cinerariifolium]